MKEKIEAAIAEIDEAINKHRFDSITGNFRSEFVCSLFATKQQYISLLNNVGWDDLYEQIKALNSQMDNIIEHCEKMYGAKYDRENQTWCPPQCKSAEEV